MGRLAFNIPRYLPITDVFTWYINIKSFNRSQRKSYSKFITLHWVHGSIVLSPQGNAGRVFGWAHAMRFAVPDSNSSQVFYGSGISILKFEWIGLVIKEMYVEFFHVSIIIIWKMWEPLLDVSRSCFTGDLGHWPGLSRFEIPISLVYFINYSDALENNL